MATRGIIKFIENDKVICKLYNHWDSYPSGLGEELFVLLEAVAL